MAGLSKRKAAQMLLDAVLTQDANVVYNLVSRNNDELSLQKFDYNGAKYDISSIAFQEHNKIVEKYMEAKVNSSKEREFLKKIEVSSKICKLIDGVIIKRKLRSGGYL